mgnify:CR=1 FL=1
MEGYFTLRIYWASPKGGLSRMSWGKKPSPIPSSPVNDVSDSERRSTSTTEGFSSREALPAPFMAAKEYMALAEAPMAVSHKVSYCMSSYYTSGSIVSIIKIEIISLIIMLFKVGLLISPSTQKNQQKRGGQRHQFSEALRKDLLIVMVDKSGGRTPYQQRDDGARQCCLKPIARQKAQQQSANEIGPPGRQPKGAHKQNKSGEDEISVCHAL